MHSPNRNVVFEIDSTIVENSGTSIRYLGVELIMYKNGLTMNVNDCIRKFNVVVYDVLLNTTDLSDVVKCELVAKKCAPILLFGVGAVQISDDSVYKMHIAYRKIFRYIFHLPLWVHLSALLNVFGVVSIADLNDSKTEKLVKQCAIYHFQELNFLSNCVRYGL